MMAGNFVYCWWSFQMLAPRILNKVLSSRETQLEGCYCLSCCGGYYGKVSLCFKIGIGYVPPPHQPRTKWDTRSNFKQITAGLNSKFSFWYIGCLTKSKESSIAYDLPIAGRMTDGFMSFPRVLYEVKCKQHRRGFEHGSPIPFTMTITAMLYLLAFH